MFVILNYHCIKGTFFPEQKEAELFQVGSSGVDVPYPLESLNHCDGPCVGVPEAKGGTPQGPDSSSLQDSA